MPTLTIRLTDKQHQNIKDHAEGMGMTRGSYIKSRVFDCKEFTLRKTPRPDQIELAKILGQLGSIGNNFNQFQRSVNSGAIAPNAEIIENLKAARAGVEMAGSQIKETLGIK